VGASERAEVGRGLHRNGALPRSIPQRANEWQLHDALLDLLAVLTLALSLGGMPLVSAVAAPLVFTKLLDETAGSYMRGLP
jgi:hypothetical protein